MSGGRWAALGVALCGGAGEDDEQDAGELGGRVWCSTSSPSRTPMAGFEGHQGPECGGCHLAQREHLEGVRQDGEQEGQPGRGGEDAEGEVAGGLRDARQRCCGGGGGDGE